MPNHSFSVSAISYIWIFSQFVSSGPIGANNICNMTAAMPITITPLSNGSTSNPSHTQLPAVYQVKPYPSKRRETFIVQPGWDMPADFGFQQPL
jgi:hypothetical protein